MDLVAPSGGDPGNVRTTDRMGNLGYNNTNYTSTFNGTSATCPQVAGVAALMLSVRPDLTEAQIRTTLQQTATDMGSSGFDNTYGFGRLNAFAAVQAVYPYILGSSIVCSSGIAFTVNNLPSGATVSWTCTSTNNNLTIDPISGYAYATNSTSSQETITAIIHTGCGNVTLPAKTVWVGEPHELELYCEGRGNLYTYSFYVTPFYDGDSIVWGTVPATAELTDLGYGYATIAFDEPGIYDIWAYVANECGDGTPAYITDFYVYELLMSPNPASTEVEITISTGLEEGSKNANWYSDDEYTVTVLDIYGTVKIQRKYSGNKFTIPVSSLKDGSYIVKINSKKINSSKQLIVKH